MGFDREAVEMLCSAELWRMAVLWTLSLLYSYFLLVLREPLAFFRRRSHQPSHPLGDFTSGPTPKGTGRPICVITGATSGLGLAAAKSLSGKGYYVVLAGRSPQLLSKTILEIKEHNEDAQLKAFQVDLSSILSIMEFKSSIEQWLIDSSLHPSVQLLINNAGIMATSCRATADGYDQMMGTNYMSAFTLTNLLLPLLKNSPLPSRIVNVTSFTHRCVSTVKAVENLNCLSTLKKYPFAHIYEYSKFFLLLFTYELHRKLLLVDSSNNVSVMAADPGVVETNIMCEVPRNLSRLAFMVLRYLFLLQSPEIGVGSIIDAALSPPEASGQYFFGGNGRTIRSSSLSYDKKLAEELWSSSCRLFHEAQHGLQVDGGFLPW